MRKILHLNCIGIKRFHSSSQYVKTGDAFGETVDEMKSVRITDDVLVNLSLE
jgi:hypothetical protein